MKTVRVALGFTQEYHFDYEDNAAPITKMTTDCSCFCLSVWSCVIHRWMLKVLFARGDLTDEVFTVHLDDLSHNPGKVTKLKKSL